jgi:hypothetical protein
MRVVASVTSLTERLFIYFSRNKRLSAYTSDLGRLDRQSDPSGCVGFYSEALRTLNNN